MILQKLIFRGLTRFHRETAIDFERLGSGVIAICGPNGSGKTSLVEAMLPAPIYRECPTRSVTKLPYSFPLGQGKLSLHFTLDDGRKYESETIIKDGGIDVARVYVDGDKLAQGVRECDAFARDFVGPREAVYASVYGVQKGGGAIQGMTPGERKAIFRHFLQTDRIAKLKKMVDERLKAISTSVDSLKTAEGDLAWLKGEIADLESRRGEAVGSSMAAEKALQDAKRAYDGLRDAGRLIAEREAWLTRKASHEKAMERALAAATAAQETAERCDSILAEPLSAPPDVEGERKKLDAATQAELTFTKVSGQASQLRTHIATAKRASEVIDRVPCGGEDACAECEFLVDAFVQRGELPRLAKELKDAEGKASALQTQAAQRAEIKRRVEDLEKRYRVHVQQQADRKTIERRRDEALKAVEAAEFDYVEAEEDFGELGPEPKKPSTGVTSEHIANAKAKLVSAEVAHTEAVKVLAKIDGELAQHKSTLSRVEARVAELKKSAKVQDAEALTFLGEAFGPNGIQALEIEAAGPDISGLANDLLRPSYGSRFSLRIATSKELEKGGEAETLAIRVLDSQRQGECDIGDLSGGEEVVVDEALRVGMAIYANRRLDRPLRTMWRDEPSASLSEENAANYVQLIRAAREQGEFHQVFVVTHNDAVRRGADGVLSIDDLGQITFRRNG